MIKQKYFCEIKPRYTKKKGFIQEKILNSEQLCKLAKSLIPKEDMNLREVFGAIFLDRQNKTLGYNIITKGGISGTIVDIKQIMQNALICNTSNIAIFHNHPSGNLKPSKLDISISKKLFKSFKEIDINMIDSIIVTETHGISIKL